MEYVVIALGVVYGLYVVANLQQREFNRGYRMALRHVEEMTRSGNSRTCWPLNDAISKLREEARDGS